MLFSTYFSSVLHRIPHKSQTLQTLHTNNYFRRFFFGEIEFDNHNPEQCSFGGRERERCRQGQAYIQDLTRVSNKHNNVSSFQMKPVTTHTVSLKQHELIGMAFIIQSICFVRLPKHIKVPLSTSVTQRLNPEVIIFVWDSIAFPKSRHCGLRPSLFLITDLLFTYRHFFDLFKAWGL